MLSSVNRFAICMALYANGNYTVVILTVMLATHCNLVPLVPDGICVKSYCYYSVQFVRKKPLAALSVKISKHCACIQRNLSMCTRSWQKLITRAPLILQLVNYIAKDGQQNHQFECFVSQSE